MPPGIGREIIDALVRIVADGRIDAAQAAAALQPMAEQTLPPASLSDLARLVEAADDPALGPLRTLIGEALIRRVRLCHGLRQSGAAIPDDLRRDLGDLPLEAPLDWTRREASVAALGEALSILDDLRFVAARKDVAPQLAQGIEAALVEGARAVARGSPVWGAIRPLDLIRRAEEACAEGSPDRAALERLRRARETEESEQRGIAARALQDPSGTPPAGVEERIFLDAAADAFDAATSLEERRRLLDMAACWPTDQAALMLSRMAGPAWARDRLARILALRFGEPFSPEWSVWGGDIDAHNRQMDEAVQSLGDPLGRRPWALLLVWCSAREQLDPGVVNALIALADRVPAAIDADEFVLRWSSLLSREEANAIAHPSLPPLPEKALAPPAARPPPLPASPPSPPVPAAAAVPPRPSWGPRARELLAENWYLVLGLLMVVAGCSVLAYHTWDKHWIVRHTAMPAVLLAVILALAGAASRLARASASLWGTATALRGAAIALLPASFMLATRLADDADVPAGGIVAGVLLAAYAFGFGALARRWCSAVAPPLGSRLGAPLILLNLLVVLRPLAQKPGLSAAAASALLEAGFYAAFLVAAIPVLTFALRSDLSRDVPSRRGAAWFVGGTLFVTLLEVLVWVYGATGLLPRPVAYAPMAVLAGGLVLVVETRFQRQAGRNAAYGRESFLGYALMIAGVLMSLSAPLMRTAVLGLTFAAWWVQARTKAHAAHDAISVALLALAIVSAAFLPGVPLAAIPAVALLAAIPLEGFVLHGRARSRPALVHTAIVLQAAGVATAIALTLWLPIAFRVELPEPAYLAGAVAVLGYRGWRDRRGEWIYAAVVVAVRLVVAADPARAAANLPLALAGIAWIWLAAARGFGDSVARATRSTVVLLTAGFTLCVMLYGLAHGAGAAGGTSAFHVATAFAGPLLMALATVSATRCSGSPLPMVLGVAIVAVLSRMPVPAAGPLAAVFRPGSGLASAFAALAAAGAALWLAAPRQTGAAAAGAGRLDPFFDGRPFPVLLRPPTLFAGPLVALAVMLAAGVQTWTLPGELARRTFDIRTALAVTLGAATWTGLAVYARRRPALAAVCVHAGWLTLLLALATAHFALSASPRWWIPALQTLVAMQCLHALYAAVGRRREWVRDILAGAMLQALRVASLAGSGAAIVALVQGAPARDWVLLPLLLAAQHVWHGLRRRGFVEGVMLFVLAGAVTLCWDRAAAGLAGDALALRAAYGRILVLLVVVQGLGWAMEWSRIRDRLRPVVLPPIVCAAAAVLLAVIPFSIVTFGSGALPVGQRALLVAGLALAARALASGPLALAAVAVAYTAIVTGIAGGPPAAALLLAPWRLALLSALMMLGTAAGQSARRRWPRLLAGGHVSDAGQPAAPWIYGSAVVLAFAPTAAMALWRGLVWTPSHVVASFLGGASLLFAAWRWRIRGVLTAAASTLAFATVRAVHVFAGPPLRAYGLTGFHLTNAGLVAVMLEAWAARRAARSAAAARYLDRLTVAAAGLILVLTAALYFTHPSVAALTTIRLAASAALTGAAALALRRVARDGGAGWQNGAAAVESACHLAWTLALWCLALTLPLLRTAGTALWALALPFAWFYARAELGARGAPPTRAAVMSASALGFLLLALYVFRSAFQVALFPDQGVSFAHYHRNAALLLLLAPALFRLRGLGGTSWLPFYAGMAAIAGSYFAWTAWPGLSPFTHAMPGAWCAVACAHAWTLVGYQRSPVRTLVLRMAGLDVREWLSNRHAWGLFILAGLLLSALWAAVSAFAARDTLLLAPLVLGCASVFLHMAWVRRSVSYLVVAAAGVVLAIHMDFLVASALPSRQAGWVVLGIWALLLMAQALLPRAIPPRAMSWLGRVLAALAFGHVLYHGPASPQGLWTAAALAILAALVPVGSRELRAVADRFAVAGLLVAPVWLVFFGQAQSIAVPPGFRPTLWSVLGGVTALLATAGLGAFVGRRPAPAIPAERPARLFDRLPALLRERGEAVLLAALAAAFAVSTPAWVLCDGLRFSRAENGLLAIVCALGATGWLERAWRRHSLPAAVAGEIGLLGMVAALRAVVRRQIGDAWSADTDVCLCLGLSAAFTGIRHVLGNRHRELALGCAGALVALPAAAFVWAGAAGWGLEPMLLLVSAQAVLWVWAGRGERRSPFNVLAVAGFVAAVCLVLWSSLALRSLHAYAIPAGTGALVLLHLFRDRVAPAARNTVRAFVLLAILGSVGYDAMSANLRSTGFLLTLLGVGAAFMILGGLTRVRIYMLMGAGAVLVDVAAIVRQAFLGMDRSGRMTILGMVVLALGVAFVVGAVYVKTRRAALTAGLDAVKRRFGEWE